MESAALLTRWTIRTALILYVMTLVLRLTSKSEPRHERGARWFWTGGLIAYLAHVVCAFHFYHDWSHNAAYAATAEETEEGFGLHWGGGLYLNYLFSLVWVLDAVWWWINPERYRARSRPSRFAIHGFMVFMAFQAVVVFEAGVVRWVGIGCAVMLAVLCLLRGADCLHYAVAAACARGRDHAEVHRGGPR